MFKVPLREKKTTSIYLILMSLLSTLNTFSVIFNALVVFSLLTLNMHLLTAIIFSELLMC